MDQLGEFVLNNPEVLGVASFTVVCCFCCVCKDYIICCYREMQSNRRMLQLRRHEKDAAEMRRVAALTSSQAVAV